MSFDTIETERPGTVPSPLASRLDSIVERAEKRARACEAAYRGLLTPEEAWTLHQNHPRASLLDVRSCEELELVGRIPGAVEIEWKLYPDWSRNPRFLQDVKNRLRPTDLVLLICRSGRRSLEAASFLSQEGFTHCFNILEGFEGDKNLAGQRTVAGWKVRNLLWSH